LEIPIDLNLSVEVWFGYGDGNDISVAVLQDGVNDVVTRHYSFDELYADLFAHEEPNERLREKDELYKANRGKKILKRMKAFACGKGIK
jgi:hypothetical protein